MQQKEIKKQTFSFKKKTVFKLVPWPWFGRGGTQVQKKINKILRRFSKISTLPSSPITGNRQKHFSKINLKCMNIFVATKREHFKPFLGLKKIVNFDWNSPQFWMDWNLLHWRRENGIPCCLRVYLSSAKRFNDDDYEESIARRIFRGCWGEGGGEGKVTKI